MFRQRKLISISAVMAALTLQGCASFINGANHPVSIASTPQGAVFEVTDKAGRVVHTGTTPSTVTLKSGNGYFKGQTYTMRFKKDGYPDKTIRLDSSVSGWYWSNILLTWLGVGVGMLIVDPITGAMYKLPESARADLGRPLADASNVRFDVTTIDQLSEAQRQRLQPIGADR